MNEKFTPPTMKIAELRAPCLMAPRGGTAGQFHVFKILPVIDPPRGRPVWGGGVHRKKLSE